MIIKFSKNCKAKKENKYVKSFTEFYLPLYFLKTKKVNIECPDADSQYKRPDYLLKEPKLLIEIKEVHDKEDLENLALWSRNVNRLKVAFESSKRSKQVKGSYLIDTSHFLKINKASDKKIIEAIIDAILNQQKCVRVLDFEFNIEKANDEGSKIYFASMGPARSINSAGTIHQNIGSKISTANEQLGGLTEEKVKRKILLLVNKYTFGDRIGEFIEALSYSYNKLLTYKNIDEIWLQIKTKEGKFLHILLCTRDFLRNFHQKNISLFKQNIILFRRWFRQLGKLGDDYKEKLFFILKIFFKTEKPDKLFPDKFIREEIVQIGNWLAEKKRFNDVVWLIDKFITDPDPVEPEKYKGDPQFNYHERITKGEDPRIIITVLGHLAWVIQKLAARKNYITKALNYTKRLLHHKNLYIKQQAIVPLTEISARRQWLDGYGKRPRTGKYKEFYDLVFDLVKLVEKNPNYKAIAEYLSHIFFYYKDLSTEEAERVLDALKITDESAGLFVYFGIFRQRHYKDQEIKFNGEKLSKKLKNVIEAKNKDYRRLRASIAWHLWKVLEENKKEFNAIKPYVDLFLKQPYQRDLYDDIERIIKDCVKDKPEVCISWFKLLLDQISKFVKSDKELHKQGGLWLMSTQEIINIVAGHRPNELLELMEKLVNLWKKGVFIGDLKVIFEIFKSVPDENLRTEAKKQFQEWYKVMKKLNPKLVKVDWD